MPLPLLAALIATLSVAPAPLPAQTLDSLRLVWTAPADLPGPRAVTRYDVRMSPSPLTAENFDAAVQVAAGRPRSPGVPETLVVRGLPAGSTYWLGIISEDAAGNRSPISNVVQWTSSLQPALDTSAPPAPTGFAAVRGPAGDDVRLTWQASPAPDLAAYTIYRALDPAGTWYRLRRVPAASPSFADADLPVGMTRLYYAVTASDWSGNESPRSATAEVVLRDAYVAAATSWRLLPAYPNPSHIGDAVHLPLEAPPSGTARLEILDAANQLVRRLDVAAGAQTGRLEWDGRNDHGAGCAPGVYRVRLTAGGTSQVIRVARVP